jgi:precorrin-3B synthase
VPIRNRETDDCPGVLATHQAADGAVARVRVPGGQLTAPAFLAIATGAAELGDGTIELTSRANLQVRGLPDGVTLGAGLTEAGLLPSATHERVRNILASPLTGRDGVGFADVRPLVTDLDRSLCAKPALADLPGRFLFAIDDGRGDVTGLNADVAAVLTSENTAAILLGGTDSGLRAPLVTVVDMMVTCAEAFLTLRDTEWRIAEVPNGPERVAAHATSPERPEGHLRDIERPEGHLRDGERPEGALQGIGRIRQVDERVALVVGAPLGWLDRRQAAALVAADAPLVVTPWRRLVVADLPSDRVDAVADRLREAGLLLDPDHPLARVTACTGRPGCAKALADVRADAAPVPDTTVPVHWSGCERRCGRPRGTVVDVIATGDGYTTTVGDR